MEGDDVVGEPAPKYCPERKGFTCEYTFRKYTFRSLGSENTMEGDEVGPGQKYCPERKGSTCRQIHPMPQFVQVPLITTEIGKYFTQRISKFDFSTIFIQVSLEAVSEGVLGRRYLKKVEEGGEHL